MSPKNINLWIPIDIWNLNELFTTESISPYAFYKKRNFGNPVNRNTQIIEAENNLVLFSDVVKCDIILRISIELIDLAVLKEIKLKGKAKVKSYEYPKTIYFRKGLIKVLFSTKDHLNQFLNNSLMLLEVKAINKYKNDFSIDEAIKHTRVKPSYQTEIMPLVNENEPYFDKVINQIKGLIYGYLIGSISSLGEKEQNLLVELTNLKNSVAGIHTDIVLAEQYSNLWLINLKSQIKSCSHSYLVLFGKESDVFQSLILRLEEVDKLNRLRFGDLDKQNSPFYKQEFKNAQDELERAKNNLYKFELNNEITRLKEQLEDIKKREELKGKSKGKKREYFKKSTEEYIQKQELKQAIEETEQNTEYKELKLEIGRKEEYTRNFQFGYTLYDTSITEQFSRISEYLHDISKRASNFFLSKSNKNTKFLDINFFVEIEKLSDYYLNQNANQNREYISLPDGLKTKLTLDEDSVITKALDTLLQIPQGLLGNHSEQNILNIIKYLGEQLEETDAKKALREYYIYRIGKSDSYSFPNNKALANLIAFLMKANGHDQINKLLITKGVTNKELAFLFYGTYVGFANMPKTFTNIIFDSDNNELFDYIDNQLHKFIIARE